MNSSATASSLSLSSWRELYKAALFEKNREKLPDRIAEAEKAIVARARELFASSADTIEEDQALDDALYALRALQSCLTRQTAAA
jgi:precorrin-2 methylase